ncbi:hypothetical protein EMPS_06445 [Entomortierella parvispora]|uniref:Uncharacterized protein n=1 Tax=Entomortierella parvispora TaxID=205924 RepID=A0A9P3HCZ3_9FUNG|nr:hypothetical protein EMPS_06445 [Entomortierella parvispora]
MEPDSHGQTPEDSYSYTDLTVEQLKLLESDEELAITFEDDENFLGQAKECMSFEQDPRLWPQLESVCAESVPLPRNEKLNQTLQALQDTYGLIVQDEPVAQNGPESLAALIVSLLNRAPAPKFRIWMKCKAHCDGASNCEGESICKGFDLPPTRLLLRRLSEILNITIVIPSTRSHTQVYRPTTGQPSRCVGILHIGNSYEQVSTYAPLTCSNLLTGPPRTPSQNPPQGPHNELGNELARFRPGKKRNQKPGYPVLQLDIAMPALQKELSNSLSEQVEKAVKKALTAKSMTEESLKKKMEAAKRFEQKRIGVPRNVMQATTTTIEPLHRMEPGTWCANNVSNQMMAKKSKQGESNWKPVHEYRLIVKKDFDNLWEKALEKAEKALEMAEKALEMARKKDRSQKDAVPEEKVPELQLRTVSVTLDNVLRKEFSADEKSRIKEILATKQADMSSHIEELRMAIMMAQLGVLQGEFRSEQCSPNEFDIRGILPEAFEIRDANLKKNSSLRVSLVPDDFQADVRRYCHEDAKRTAVETDNQDLFSQECIQYIAAQLKRNLDDKTASSKKQKRGSDDDHDDEDPITDEEQGHRDEPDDEEEEDDNSDPVAGPSSLGTSRSVGTKRPRPAANAKQSHPLWTSMAAFVSQAWNKDAGYVDNVECPKGLSTSRLGHIKTMAANYKNIWKAKMYLDLKRAVIRYLLRVHLRPLGEQRYRDLKKKFAESKAAKAAEKLQTPYVRRKAYRWTLKKLFIQLDEAISTCKSAWNSTRLELRDPIDLKGRQPRTARVQNILCMISDFCDKIKVADEEIVILELELKRKKDGSDEQISDSDGIPSEVDIIELAREENDRDYLDEDDLADEDDGFDEAAMECAQEDPSDESTPKLEPEQEASAEDEPAPEPSSKHLQALEAVTGILLDKADCPAEILPDYVRDHLYEPEKFSDDEIKAVVDIVNKLRPYTPKRDDSNKLQEHILVLGPFCFLANNLLRALGYPDFARKLFPMSSCGKSHPTVLDAPGIREVLCSRNEEEFEIVSDGKVLSTDQAKKHVNVKKVLGAFFDLNFVMNVCKRHHLRFEERIVYVDPWTVQIMGSKTNNDSVQDAWSEKKKKHIQPSSKSKHPSRQQELVQSGITADAAEERAKELEETLKEKAAKLGKLNRAIAKQAKQQSLLNKILQDKLSLVKASTVSMDVDNEESTSGSSSPAEMDLDTGQDMEAAMDVDTDPTESDTEPITKEALQIAYNNFNDQRIFVQNSRAEIPPLAFEIKNLKEERYAYQKYAREKKAAAKALTSSRANSKGKGKSVAPAPASSSSATIVAAVNSARSRAAASKSSSSAPAKPTYTSTPSGARPGSMDYVEATCIKQLRKDIAENNGKSGSRQITLVPGGTDPGAKTLFETVVVPESTLIKLQNRFHLLSEESEDPPEATADQDELEMALKAGRKEALALIKIPETHKTTVAHIRHLSGLTRQTKRRKKAIERTLDIQSVYDKLGTMSPLKANTVADMKKAATGRRDVRDKVHAFEHTKSMARASRNVARRLKRTYDHVAAKERQVFKNMGQGKYNV